VHDWTSLGRRHRVLFECTDTLQLITPYLSWHSGNRACQTPRVVTSAVYQAFRPAQEAKRVKCPLTGAAQISFVYCAQVAIINRPMQHAMSGSSRWCVNMTHIQQGISYGSRRERHPVIGTKSKVGHACTASCICRIRLPLLWPHYRCYNS